MPLDSNAWIGIVLIAALIVAAIAVWKGRPFSAKGPGFKFGTPQEEPKKIKVGNNLTGVDLTAGSIIGTTSNGSDADIEVANKASFKRTKLRDIIGAGNPTGESKERSSQPSKTP